MDVLYEAVCDNVWFTMSILLERSPAIAAAVRGGDLLLKGAVYSLQTGQVALLEEKG